MFPLRSPVSRPEPETSTFQNIEDQILNDETPHETALATLEKKLHLVRDLVTAVAMAFKTGLFLYGMGGVGKSYTVLRHLESLDVPHKLFNSRMTAKGLFLTLKNAPDSIHVMEDMERLTKDPDAQGVLRSALWSQPGHDREVTWTTATDGSQRFNFRGGLILISNRPLADLPELRALATRIEVHRLGISDAELTALMRALAAKGYSVLDKLAIGPEDCMRVTEHLLKECRSAGCPLDLRLQQKAFQTYLQFAADRSVSHWEDLSCSQRPQGDVSLPPRGEHEVARSQKGAPTQRRPRDRNSLHCCEGAGRGVHQEDGSVPSRLLPPQARGGQRRVRRCRCRLVNDQSPWPAALCPGLFFLYSRSLLCS